MAMEEDLPNTGGASSSSASGGPAMDSNSQTFRKRAADAQVEDLEEDDRVFSGNWGTMVRCVRGVQSARVCELAGKERLVFGASMDITTVDEQGRPWDFTEVEMRNHAYRKMISEKPFLLVVSHMCARWREFVNRNLCSMTEEQRNSVAPSPRALSICVSLVQVTA